MSKFLQQEPIILASGSSIRFKLMSTLGIDFRVVPSTCDEEAIKAQFKGTDYIQLGYQLAEAKAREVSQRYPDEFVIAADQLCVLGDTLFDKPMNHPTAISHLQQLSGQTHRQIACVCLAKNNSVLWLYHDIAYLTLHGLTDDTIESYLKLEKPYHSCGAYQFETMGKWLFKEVQGNEDTILGLPLLPLINALNQFKAVHIK